MSGNLVYSRGLFDFIIRVRDTCIWWIQHPAFVLRSGTSAPRGGRSEDSGGGKRSTGEAGTASPSPADAAGWLARGRRVPSLRDQRRKARRVLGLDEAERFCARVHSSIARTGASPRDPLRRLRAQFGSERSRAQEFPLPYDKRVLCASPAYLDGQSEYPRGARDALADQMKARSASSLSDFRSKKSVSLGIESKGGHDGWRRHLEMERPC